MSFITIFFKAIPARVNIGIMIFMACLFSYMLRVNMSINIIAMVQPRINQESGRVAIPECLIVNNITKENYNLTVPDYGVRYDWDQQIQGLILGSYFWGYILTAIPGGFLAERFGPLHVVGWSTALTGLLTILIPTAASVHYIVVITIRFILGFLGGVVYPALHCLLSKWSPPTEKGRFAGTLFGGNFGTVITWPVLGAVSQSLGWSWSFYIPGGLCLLWCLLWYYLVADSPSVHKRISQEEREYIEKCIGNSISNEKRIPPYVSIIKSVPFLALMTLHFGNLWGLYFLMTAGPKFMAEVLGFNLAHSGGLAALPYLARLLLGFVFGAIGDIIRSRKWMSVTAIRKWFVIFSSIIPGLLLLSQTIINCNVVASVALLTMSLGFNGASAITNIQNPQDLAPNFAGTIYGIINGIGGTTGFITPILTGYFTNDHNGMEEWRIIFTIGASVYIASGIVFCIFGSGEIQPWNNKGNVILSKIYNKTDDTNGGFNNKAFEQSEATSENNSKINKKVDLENSNI